MNLKDLLSHYGRVMPAGVEREVDRAIRAFGERHLREMTAQPLGRGDSAPDVTLSDLGRLSSLLSVGPVVLKFYLGRWCPYCTLELRAWQRSLEALEGLGARLLAISPQDPAETESTRRRDRLTMPLISDRDNAVARRFGIAYPLCAEEQGLMLSVGVDLAVVNRGASGWSLPLPALYVIGRDRRIAYSFVAADYRHRAEPEEVMAAICALRRS